MESNLAVPQNTGLVDSQGNPLSSGKDSPEVFVSGTAVPTHDEQRAAMLRANPQFRKIQRKVEHRMKQLKRTHPNKSPSELLQLAAHIVTALEGKPASSEKKAKRL